VKRSNRTLLALLFLGIYVDAHRIRTRRRRVGLFYTFHPESLVVRDALVAAINERLKTSAFSVPISRLNVERTADGAPVAPVE
jgi:hypothetical protein